MLLFIKHIIDHKELVVSIPKLEKSDKKLTVRQGQFLAFIFYYTKVNKQPPAEADIQAYFNISSASTHQMIKTLVQKNLLHKTPRQSRSMKVLVSEEQLPKDW